MEVLVTQGDTIYKSEAETLCSNLTLNDFDAIFDFIKKPNSGRAVSKSVESLNEDNVKTFSEAVKEDPLHVGTSKAPATSVETGDASVLFFDPLLRPPPSLVAPWAHSLVVFVPLRLGINYVNPEYHEVRHNYRHYCWLTVTELSNSCLLIYRKSKKCCGVSTALGF